MVATIRTLDTHSQSVQYIHLPKANKKKEESTSFTNELQHMLHGSERPYEEGDEITLAGVGDMFLDAFAQIRRGTYIGQSSFFDKTHLQ